MAATAQRTPGGAGTSSSCCVGSAGFDPDEQVRDEKVQKSVQLLLDKDDFQGAVTLLFKLPAVDSYVYHAIGSVQLAEVQHVIGLGGKNGLHDWYRDSEGKPLPAPPEADIRAYTSIFLPQTSTSNALKSLGANAKKGSIRASVAAHLASRRYVHPAREQALAVPKSKTAPPNPSLPFWEWSCRNLGWAGPSAELSQPPLPTAADGKERASSSSSSSSPAAAGYTPRTHHVLPVLMHHFSCAQPSHEALQVLKVLAAGRTVLDAGSGNGYWTYLLRAHGVPTVAVDNGQSAWRVSWLGPGAGTGAGAVGGTGTVAADAAAYLRRRHRPPGGPDLVLLMVYPVVGGGGLAGGQEGGFVRGLMAAYAGDTVAVVGAQDRSGYTAFRSMTFAEYMAREQPAWTKVVQIPLPSFAGKDEALFVFQRGERAPQ